jgi:hypothetical protein
MTSTDTRLIIGGPAEVRQQNVIRPRLVGIQGRIQVDKALRIRD